MSRANDFSLVRRPSFWGPRHMPYSYFLMGYELEATYPSGSFLVMYLERTWGGTWVRWSL